MFGFAVLAKGLVPLALAAPLLLGRHVRDWLRWRVVAAVLSGGAALVRAVLLAQRWAFIHEFFVVHHFSRVTSDALMHGRPCGFTCRFWWRACCPGRRCSGCWPGDTFTATGSACSCCVGVGRAGAFLHPVNKLPGYILPLLPAAAALMALALDEVPDARVWLAACAVLLVALSDHRPGAAGRRSERAVARSASGVPGGVAGARSPSRAGLAVGGARQTSGRRTGGGRRERHWASAT